MGFRYIIYKMVYSILIKAYVNTRFIVVHETGTIRDCAGYYHYWTNLGKVRFRLFDSGIRFR
jgi:hypothetical protein